MHILSKMTIYLAAMTFAVMPLQAQAQPNAIALSSDVKAVTIVTAPDGTERTELVEPGTVVPGARLIFSTSYENVSSDVVTNFNVTNPLPTAVRLASEADPELTVSVDGGKAWGKLEELQIIDEDGTARAATHDDVTDIRWTLKAITPGEKGQLSYPAIVR